MKNKSHKWLNTDRSHILNAIAKSMKDATDEQFFDLQASIKEQKNRTEFELDWNQDKTGCTFKVLAFVDGKKIEAFLEAYPEVKKDKTAFKR